MFIGLSMGVVVLTVLLVNFPQRVDVGVFAGRNLRIGLGDSMCSLPGSSSGGRITVAPQTVSDLSLGWKVTYGVSGITTIMDRLRSWTDDESTLYYSGNAAYERGFSYEPVAGKWYRDLEEEESFQVLSVDEDQELIEIQHLDGDIEELDLDTWAEMDVEPTEEPEGWSGSGDDDDDVDDEDWDEDEDEDWDDDEDEDDDADEEERDRDDY